MRNTTAATAAAVLLLSGKSLAQSLCTGSALTSGVSPQVTDFAAFESQLAPFTATATGAEIPVYTNTVDLGATIVTATGFAKSDALVSAGYTVTSAWVTTSAPCGQTITSRSTGLPPQPTGKNCTPHGDHWHCEDDDEDDHDHEAPTTTTSSSSTVAPSPTGKNCTQHGDHWHCDDEDDDDHSTTATTAAPSTTSSATLPPSPTGKNCVAHGDHWDCEDEDTHSTTTATTPSTVAPSPTGKNCTQHGDHWHCDGEDDDHSNDDEEEEQTAGKGNSTTTPVEKPVEFDGAAAAVGFKPGMLLAGVLGSAIAAFLL